MSRANSFSVLCPFLLTFAISCQGRESAAGSNTTRDSAGITIIENTANTWTDSSAWRIDATPLVAIGQMDGPAEYQLFRVTRAIRLPSGAIVIANAGSHQIRFYDSAGKHLRSVGREGSGPGEYQFINFLRQYGRDSLVAWDFPLERGTVLSVGGDYARNFAKPENAPSYAYYVDAFSDGSLLSVWDNGVRPDTGASGPMRFNSLLARVTTTGRADTIGTFFAGESFITADKTLISMPFSHRGVYAAYGDHLYYGSGERWELQEYTNQGRLVRIIRGSRPNPPLTGDSLKSWLTLKTAAIKDPSRRAQFLRWYSEIDFPKELPTFSDIVVDSEGNVWTGDYHESGGTPTRWTVFDPHGALLGDVAAPGRINIFEIGSDYVLGRSLDDNDVEHVVLHRLRKPAAHLRALPALDNVRPN